LKERAVDAGIGRRRPALGRQPRDALPVRAGGDFEGLHHAAAEHQFRGGALKRENGLVGAR
jgi:hypothetical protein